MLVVLESLSGRLKHLIQVSDAAFAGQAIPDFTLTRKEFSGDLTLVVFSLSKALGKSPQETASFLGEHLMQHASELLESYSVVQGFLNLKLRDEVLYSLLQGNPGVFLKPAINHEDVTIEFSSPNTNKPLHLGHVRNILLGDALSRINTATGHRVRKVCLVNDRGIHICKSMLAWKISGLNETPERSGIKGDHLVGKYYVLFDTMLKQEQSQLIASGMSAEEAIKKSPLMEQARLMLQQWEQGDAKVVELWRTMNGWVHAGFERTYHSLGISFDAFHLESDVYRHGKEIVEEGVGKGVFFKKEDGSVWLDLSEIKLDEKCVLRADGTSVYITQDLATAAIRQKEKRFDRMMYVVGNEQDYHFKVLFYALRKMGYAWSDKLNHISYGMVELPHGKMKSREGTVVDADDLILEMSETATEISAELGKTEGLNDLEKEKLISMVALGALKYFILKVDPKKKMVFNPAESIDFHGHTGPFIQYTHARIRSVIRKSGKNESEIYAAGLSGIFSPVEREKKLERALLVTLLSASDALMAAAHESNPAVLANYLYELARAYNLFYHDCSILNEEHAAVKSVRLLLSLRTADTIREGMDLLGIMVPEVM